MESSDDSWIGNLAKPGKTIKSTDIEISFAKDSTDFERYANFKHRKKIAKPIEVQARNGSIQTNFSFGINKYFNVRSFIGYFLHRFVSRFIDDKDTMVVLVHFESSPISLRKEIIWEGINNGLQQSLVLLKDSVNNECFEHHLRASKPDLYEED